VSTILFDLDGTLTDPREGITRSIAYALERMGLEPPPLADLTFAIGPPLRASLARLIGRGWPPRGQDQTAESKDVERALMFFRERFTDIGLFENQPYDGVHEALAALRARGAALHVATSKPSVYAVRIIERFGLAPHFVAIHGCELDGTREDKRDLIAHLMPRHGIEAHRATMVGDRGADMIAARHHGLRAVGALWGYGTREELLEGGAQALCAEPAALGDLAD
jgi:phosphoglycolate phosphatase